MSDVDVRLACPIDETILIRRDRNPRTALIGGMTPGQQGLPPFWWYCRRCGEYYRGIDLGPPRPE